MDIVVEKLEKNYSAGFSLGPVSLSLSGGETVAMLGKNGAGKSTLFQQLTGNADASSGCVKIDGAKLTPDKFELKRKIGYLPQDLHLPRWSTGIEILRYGAALYELPQPGDAIEAALDYWDCNFYKDKPLSACSHGMQKRIGLAVATLHNPACLILDEPFSGLDIYHIRALENTIISRQEKGLITILSTHITPYVVQLCKKVFVVEQGAVTRLQEWETIDASEKLNLIESRFFDD